ncbi:MAG: SUMF1/EgtB/PvdO family nonheme iron enzyme [Rhodospirillales bacterium]
MIATIRVFCLSLALALAAVGTASAQESVAGPVLKEAYDLYSAGKLPDAAVKFEQGLRLNPARDQAAVAFFLLGETYRQMGEDFKAKANYEASLQANPASQVAQQARDRLAAAPAATAAPALPSPQAAPALPSPQAAPALPPPPPPTASGLPPAPPPAPPPSAQTAPPPRPALPVPPAARPPAPPRAAQAPRPAPPPAAPPIALFKPGTIIKDCEICPAMVVIPPGAFQMGSNSGDGDEKPVHPVTIPRPLAVGRFEVTFAEYDACLAAGGCRSNVSDNGWGRGTNPVIHVAWTDAMDYARWLSAITGKRYRLPSEAEWEYAARGGAQSEDVKIGKGQGNCDDCGTPWDNRRVAPVGRFPPNGYGLYDMLGNAWEWTLDCWVDNYRGAPPDGLARANGDCSRRVLRGGGYKDGRDSSRAANRNKDPITDRDPDNGFRVVRELP